uniref:YecA/YgfB family protein n=1 Tax=uncultured Acidovorax sp. TaxID=158751 RepID=UPI0025E77A74
MTEPTSPTPAYDDLDASAAPAAALGPDELEEMDNILDDLRARGEEIPQWEFCDGFMTALICSRRPIGPAEYLPMLLGDGAELDVAEGEPLPLLPAFADAAQQARFMDLWMRRWNEIVAQLDTDVKTLDDDRTFQPEAMDMRGAVASLTDEQRAEMGDDQEIPSFGQVWALGFMFAVENWPEDWAAPRDKEAA